MKGSLRAFDRHELSFARPLLPVSVQNQVEAACHSRRRWESVWCSDDPLTWEAIVQVRTTGLLLLGAMTLPTSALGQASPAPPAITRTVIAATKLPTVTDVPVHFKAVSIILQPDERSSVSAANGILYQMSGSTEVVLDGEAKMLNAGDGLFIAGGKTSALTAAGGAARKFLPISLSSPGGYCVRRPSRPLPSRRHISDTPTHPP